MRILIVDDEPGVRSSLRAMLCAEDNGPEVDEAGGGQAALDLLAERPADLVITDMKMPGLSGIGLIERLRQYAYGGEIAVISGFDDYQLVRAAMKLGASDYLLKPVQPEELVAVLDRLEAEELSAQAYIAIQNGRSIFRLPFDRLASLEVCQKKLHFHLTDGQIRQIPGTISSVEAELLAQPDFMKIHRSYIVNLRHISSLSPEGCVLTSGDNLPISRLLYQQVRRQYIAYLFDDAEE